MSPLRTISPTLPRAHRRVVRINHLEVEPWQDAKPLLHGRMRLDLKGHVAGRFRHAESLDEIAVEEGGDPMNQRGIGRGAPGEDPEKVGKLPRLNRGGLAHQLQHRRHQLDYGDMLVGQELADLLKLQLVLVEDVARAEEQRDPYEGGVTDVEHWAEMAPAVVIIGAEFERLDGREGMDVDIVVGVQNGLGQSGCSRSTKSLQVGRRPWQ